MTSYAVVDHAQRARKAADSSRAEDAGTIAGARVREGSTRTADGGLRAFRAPGARASMTQPYSASAPTVRIHQRGRSATQSGRAGETTWLLTFEPRYRLKTEPLMGWTSSRDTLQQVSLQFATADAAVGFAERCGLNYEVEPTRPRVVRPKRYADNFRHDGVPPGSP